MNSNLYKQASDLENSNPQKALKIYTKLEDENLEFHWDILLIGILCPVVAFIIAFIVRLHFEIPKILVTVFIWCGIGFFPSYMIYENKRKKKTGIKLKKPHNIFVPLRNTLILFFHLTIEISGMIVIAAIANFFIVVILGPIYHVAFRVPLTWNNFYKLPEYIAWPITLICFIYAFLLVMSDPVRVGKPLVPYIFQIKRILIGVKHKLKKIIFWIFAVSFAWILYSGSIDFFNDTITPGLITSILGGILFSLNFGYLQRDYRFGLLIKIGKFRCLTHMSRHIEVDYLLIEMERGVLSETNPRYTIWTSNYPKTIRYLIHAIMAAVDYATAPKDLKRSDASDYLAEAIYAIEADDPSIEIYLDSIQKIESLFSLPHYSEKKWLRDHCKNKYTGIGRVLASGYKYPEGEDPREYERYEYEVYKTGQWIDLEVIDGVMYFNRLFHKGEIIKGIWQCGETDGIVEIMDELKTGDTVGYSSFDSWWGSRFHVWEKAKWIKMSGHKV
ncbi:MAG: hypothetical protein ACE5K4_11865 [Candidatus Hydrothermarchaeota archaeon]